MLVIQMSVVVKPWSSRVQDVHMASRLMRAGLPALAIFEAKPLRAFDAREHFAELFIIFQVATYLMPHLRCTMLQQCSWLQEPRDFLDILSPQLEELFVFASQNVWYLHIFKHLMLGEAGKLY